MRRGFWSMFESDRPAMKGQSVIRSRDAIASFDDVYKDIPDVLSLWIEVDSGGGSVSGAVAHQPNRCPLCTTDCEHSGMDLEFRGFWSNEFQRRYVESSFFTFSLDFCAFSTIKGHRLSEEKQSVNANETRRQTTRIVVSHVAVTLLAIFGFCSIVACAVLGLLRPQRDNDLNASFEPPNQLKIRLLAHCCSPFPYNTSGAFVVFEYCLSSMQRELDESERWISKKKLFSHEKKYG